MLAADHVTRTTSSASSRLGHVRRHRRHSGSGHRRGLDAVLEAALPDLVVVAAERGRPEIFRQLADAASLGFRVVGLPEFYEHAFGRVPIRGMTDAWFMSILHLYQRPYSRFAKRAFDLSFAGLGLLITAPLFPLIALMIRATGGPVFYRQTRLGEHGQPFTILKFRSMRTDAETYGAVWASESDPRITTIGRVLRKSRLDELPQLINVIRGDMSIVGPRPERPEFLDMLEDSVPFWVRRHLLRPGITGWAQLRAGYAADSNATEEKLAHDLWYLRHQSLMIDLDDLRANPPRAPSRYRTLTGESAAAGARRDRRSIAATPDVVVTIVTITGCFALWSAHDAGYEEILWYPVALLVLLLGAVLTLSTPARAPGKWTTVSLATFAAYVGWAYLSIIWAGDKGIALVGANRTLLYLILFAVLATRRWRGTDALALAAVWALATIVVGCVTLMRVTDSAHPASFFVSGRLATPVDYANANAALFVLASWPFLVGVQDRRLPALLRAAAAALATVAAALAVLSQSKGAAIGVATTLIVVLAVIPNRGRFLVSVLLVGGVIAAFHAPLLHLYTQLNAEGDQRHAARVAALSVVGSAVVAGVLGLVVATIDRAVVDRRPRGLRIASAVLVAAAAASVAAACAGVVVHYGGPSQASHRGWHAFTHPAGTECIQPLHVHDRQPSLRPLARGSSSVPPRTSDRRRDRQLRRRLPPRAARRTSSRCTHTVSRQGSWAVQA